MRILDEREIDEVQGGFGVWGALIGGAISACGALHGGSSGWGIVVAGAAGAGSGFFGGLIGAGGSAVANTLYATKALSLGVAANSVGSND